MISSAQFHLDRHWERFSSSLTVYTIISDSSLLLKRSDLTSLVLQSFWNPDPILCRALSCTESCFPKRRQPSGSFFSTLRSQFHPPIMCHCHRPKDWTFPPKLPPYGPKVHIPRDATTAFPETASPSTTVITAHGAHDRSRTI